MILTVDIGNTNIKVGAWDADRLVFVSRMHTNIQRTTDEYAVQLLDVFRLNDCNSAQFDGAILSSVVPPLSHVFKAAVEDVIQSKRVFLVSPGLKTGLNIKIDNPAALGSDLVCAAVAALSRLPLPCIFISMGTATALFALDRDGAFMGGAVSPGVVISLEALSRRTAQLPHISLEEPAGIIGKNTIDSMKSGIMYGTAAMLDGMIVRMKEAIGADAKVVAFGGLAAAIIGYCREDIEIEDHLVLEGLKIIYHKNVKLG
ncbi:MAG: type III pantothenate kinase [Oscillospiraceae bacterium]|jgi:type III pantothenate kinase|nr:type III pantothenate kinase [Oscillospiraceae bacterium]